MLSKVYAIVLFRVCLVLSLTFIWNQIWHRWQKPKLEIICCMVGFGSVIYLITQGMLGSHYGLGSYSAIYFFKIVVTVLAIGVLGYIKIHLVDYIILIGSLYWIQSFCYFQNIDVGIMLGSIWIILYMILKRRYKETAKISVSSFISYIGMVFCFFFYEFIFEKIFRNIYYGAMHKYDFVKWQKFLALIVLAMIFLVIIMVVFFALQRAFQKYFYKLSDLGEKYIEIGQYIGYAPISIFAVFLGTGAIELLIGGMDSRVTKLIMVIFTILILGMQLFYIKLLLKTVELREHLNFAEEEQITLKLYNSNLQENMKEIRAIKHDIKNIFLTMGEYVERSTDADLKEFYQEKIVPFASNEIKMNDLYVELQAIPNESLRAFIYYKLMQGIESRVDMQLHTSMDGTYSQSLYNLPDFIRILGVFIDNSIEEAVQTEDKQVIISIFEQDEKISITVKNSIRPTVKEKGIIPGTTTKGLGRGNGLTIAKQIIEKYDNILWNSYFQDNLFVQMISFAKDENA